ncbi:MAG TPA: GNAT family N-acetyltransferase [Jatrophihabitantaceae bacterium]|nr:GNAT family N-acetyltransferase [Jatrophihabitantaceae bacterium]
MIDGVAGPSEITAASPLRAARLDDLSELMRLAREFYDEDGFTTRDAELDHNLRALLADRSSARICLAVDNGSGIGFALTTCRVVLESGVVAELQDLYVMPAYRRHGVGTRLINDAISWAKAQQASSLEVVVAPNGRDVSRLLSYYRAKGLVDEGRWLLNLVL